MEWVHCHIAREAAPPHERNGQIPVQLSAVVMKLLSKTAEERYQTAPGVEADLRHCLHSWESRAAIEPFSLGARDVPARLLIPEKLYGREQESRQLLEAFARVEACGRPELVLVSGYSGIGKSSLVNELQRAIVRPRGLFASGKFGLQRSDEPYFIFAQAFQSLLDRILAASTEELAAWRTAIQSAVGADGRVLTVLIPGLELVIGAQPEVLELSLVEAKNRLHSVFVKFLGAFARAEHPLVLFLDDLQWLDSGSLALFEHLASHPDLQYLLLVAAYRANEVGPAHPLALTFDAIRRAQASVTELRLANLSQDDVQRLVSDALHCDWQEAGPLAQCLYDKTDGNPFFTLQFLHFLEDERLLEFDPVRAGWRWDIHLIRAQSISDNVAELVAGKLERLPEGTLHALQRMACLGSTVATSTLLRILGQSESQIHGLLWPAVLGGVVTRGAGSFRFLHDRVQEAAYSLILPAQRAALHLALGRLLLEGLPEASLEENSFELLDQFNRGLEAITQADETRVVRRLNTLAGRRAMGSAAFGSASVYLGRARELLPSTAWNSDYDETLPLVLDAAESDFMAGQQVRAESLFSVALAHARSLPERAEVYRRRAKLQRVSGRYFEAVEICAEGLRLLGVSLPPANDEGIGAAIGGGLARLQANLQGKRIADLALVPPTERAEARILIALAAEVLGPAYYSKSPYLGLAALAGATTTLEHGPAPASPILYNVCAYLLSALGDVDTAQQLTEMALCLQERIGDEAARGALLVSYGTIVVWRRPFAICAGILEEAFRADVRVGNVSSAGDAAMTALLTRFEAGQPLDQLAHAAEQYLGFARSSRNEAVYPTIRFFLQFVNSFRTPAGSASGQQAELEASEDKRCLAAYEKSGFTAGIGIFHILQEISAFVFGRHEEALSHARAAEPYVINVLFTLQERNQPLFQALAAAAVHESASPERRQELSALITSALVPLGKMAQYGPGNFGDRLVLVEAEVARMAGRELDAMRLYDAAILSARENGLVHREALAHEVAARFYAQRGFETIAHAYLRGARSAYLRWGATAKVRQLDQLHRAAFEHRPSVDGSGGVELRDLDLLAVVKASQAVSGEIVLERFIEKLLQIMLESAGAERGALIRPQENGFVVEAEAVAHREGVEVRMLEEPLSPEHFPESMLRFAARTGERVLLDDATAGGVYAEDAYVLARRPRSVLVLPLSKQSSIVALLYLENRLATRAFTPGQVAVMQLLASQAAISLENARLYRKLERAEERFSKAFRDSPSPMAIVRMKDEILLDANARFLEIYGYSREDLLGQSLSGLGLLDPEEAERLRALAATQGGLREEEMSIRNKQGKTLCLLGSLEPIDLGGEPCALVTHVDITGRKHTEFQLRQSQKMEAIGRLAGGVAHDFNNLLTVINGYSSMALAEMDTESPVYDMVRDVLGAGERAAVLTRQLLAHSRLQIQQTRSWSLNVIVLGMVAMLTRLIGEDTRLETELDPDLGQANLDRGQVEQILLNLVVNARDAVSGSGRIVIRTGNVRLDQAYLGEHMEATSGPHVMLAVSDNGSGMSAEVKARLFEPFFTTKPPGQGTGLGLSVVYGIVKQSGGSVSVYSEPGMGSVFRIYFPEVIVPEGAARPPEEPPRPLSSPGDEVVLLVEDAPQVRKFAAIALRAQGYEVTEAANGVEALIALEARPDIKMVITDVVMPDMGGATLAARIRALRPSLPILFMSGFVEHAEVRDVIAAAGERLLQKPFTPFELAKRVRELLDG
jgi:PAS domain S-box-containing protein